MTDERRKKSWREIDSAKDGSKHGGRQDRPGTSAHQARTTKTYKAELDRFFNSGVASTRIKSLMTQSKEKGATLDDESPEKIQLIRKIRAAETFNEFVSAVDDLRARYGLPNDVEILGRVLEHPETEPIRDSLTRLLDLTKHMDLTTMKTLSTRLDALEIATDDPAVGDLIVELRTKL